jgi:hypothetical protein
MNVKKRLGMKNSDDLKEEGRGQKDTGCRDALYRGHRWPDLAYHKVGQTRRITVPHLPLWREIKMGLACWQLETYSLPFRTWADSARNHAGSVGRRRPGPVVAVHSDLSGFLWCSIAVLKRPVHRPDKISLDDHIVSGHCDVRFAGTWGRPIEKASIFQNSDRGWASLGQFWTKFRMLHHRSI